MASSANLILGFGTRGRNQVELMQVDNVASPKMLGFGGLGFSLPSIEKILPEILWDH